MENKSKTWIIVLVVVVVLMLPILIDFISNSKIKEITYDKFLEVKENNENAIIYVGDLAQDAYKNTVDTLKKVMSSATNTDYSSDYSVYSIDSSELTEDEIANLGTSNGYLFMVEGDSQKTLASATEDHLVGLVNAYYNANFNPENTSYKIAKNAKEYEKLVNSKDITIAVFGRDTCYYCNIYKPVYNAVAEKYGLDIYYFDSDNYNSKEYQKILKLGLTIPAECNSTGKESLLSEGFGTPLTLITKKGKTIDCISGYVNRETLVAKLTENKLIKK